MKPTEAPSDTAPKLSEFLCFAIYSTNLAFGKAYKPSNAGQTAVIQWLAYP